MTSACLVSNNFPTSTILSRQTPTTTTTAIHNVAIIAQTKSQLNLCASALIQSTLSLLTIHPFNLPPSPNGIKVSFPPTLPAHLIPISIHLVLTFHRFGSSTLHQRDLRSSLFENYAGDRTRPTSSSHNPSHSPASGSGGYGYGYGVGARSSTSGGGSGGGVNGDAKGNGGLGYRPATPNSRSVTALRF